MNSRIEQINWLLVSMTAIGLLVAGFLGVTIGQSEFFILILIILILGLLSYVFVFQEYTWQIALLISYIGILFRPLGFDFGPVELTCGLGLLLAFITGWRRWPKQKAAILEDGSFKVLKAFLFLWLLYVAIHLVYNIYNPFRLTEFALKNAAKTYFASLAPAVLLWYFLRQPASIRVKGNVMRVLALLLLTGVIVNLAITFNGIMAHHNIADPEATDQMPSMFIPVINARDNPYALRGLGPAAILLGATALSLGRRTTGVPRTLSVLLLIGGSVGCLLSGGRAAVTTSIVLVLAMLLLTKRFRTFCTILLLAGTFVLSVNVFSGWVNRNAAVPLVRPLQWVMVSKNRDATNSIESSSRWREELFKMSIAEWRSDPRIFWFGRATYGFGVSDFVAAEITGGYKAAMEASLRRGATHALLTDLLVTYGLIGCILYYGLSLAIIRFLWTAYRSQKTPRELQPLALFCLISYASYLAIASVAGGLYLPELIWLVIILIAALHFRGSEQALKQPREVAPALPRERFAVPVT